MSAAWKDRHRTYKHRTCHLCYRPVKGVSQWCAHHRRRASRYGHPRARPLRAAEVRQWKSEARRFLRRYGSHPSCVRALATTNARLERRRRFRYPKLRKHLDRLVSSGVSPGEVLEVVTAVGLCYWASDRLHDGQVWREAVRLTMRLRQRSPGSRELNPEGLRELAGEFRRHFGQFVYRVAERWKIDRGAEEEHQKLLGLPIGRSREG